MDKENDKKDPVKYFGVFLTFTGILLWVTGYSFNAGYWVEAGFPQSYIPTTLQETILRGVFAIDNWFGLMFFLAGMGIYYLVFSFVISWVKRRFKKASSENNSQTIQPSLHAAEPGLTQTGIGLLVAAIAVGFMLFSVAFWSLAAERQGKTEYRRIVCENASPASWREFIILADKSELKGASVSVADGFTLLMTDKNLLLVEIKNGPKIVQSVKLPQVDCAKEFPPKKNIANKVASQGSLTPHVLMKTLLRTAFVIFFIVAVTYGILAYKAINPRATEKTLTDEPVEDIILVKQDLIQYQKHARYIKKSLGFAVVCAITQVVIYFLL